MPVVGITGGISTGKTTFGEMLRELLPAALFFDADRCARELTENDPEVRESIRAEFGAAIYSGSDLNRARLRAIVFADPEKKRALEQILHPRIRRHWSAKAESRRNPTDLFLADIPLVYETAGETLCDRVVVVACSATTQLQRLMGRASLEQAAAEKMIDSQMPLTDKMKRADHVVWNNGERDVLFAQAGMLAGLWL